MDEVSPNAAGNLGQVISWLDRIPTEALIPEFHRAPALQAILRSTPAAIGTLTASLPPQAWSLPPRPREWSLTEIVCHLRDVEADLNLPRFERVLREENPFLPSVDTNAWAEVRGYAEQGGPAALHSFTAARVATLELLARLSPEQWLRPARHSIFGPTTLRELVKITASHDRLHVQQIKQVLDRVKV